MYISPSAKAVVTLVFDFFSPVFYDAWEYLSPIRESIADIALTIFTLLATGSILTLGLLVSIRRRPVESARYVRKLGVDLIWGLWASISSLGSKIRESHLTYLILGAIALIPGSILGALGSIRKSIELPTGIPDQRETRRNDRDRDEDIRRRELWHALWRRP